MKGFVVRALTQVGFDSLDRCIQEEKVELCKRSFLDRMKFHKIWIQKIERDPLRYSMFVHPDAERLLLQSNPQLISQCIQEVKIAMSKHDAVLDQDYFVDEVNL